MKFKKICGILSVMTALLLMNLTKFPFVSAENDTVYFSQFDRNVNGGEPIRGVDLSSILAVENAGVTFCNEYGRNRIFFGHFPSMVSIIGERNRRRCQCR